MKTGFFSHAVWPLTKSEESSIKTSQPKAAPKSPVTPGVPKLAEPVEPDWPENLHENTHVQWHRSPSGGGGVNYQSPPEQGLLRNGFYMQPKVSGSTYWAVKATIPDKVFQQGIDIGAATRTEHVADNLTNIFANKRNGLLPLPSKLYSGKTGQIVGDDYKWEKNEPAYRVTPVKEGRELYDVANKSPDAATKARNQSLVWQALIDHTDAHAGNFLVPKGRKAQEGMWLIDHGGALTHDPMGLPKHHHSYNTWGASMKDHDILPGLFMLLFQSSKSGNRPDGHALIDQARDIVDTYDANKEMVHSAFTHHPQANESRKIFSKRVDVLRRMIGRYGDDPKALEEKISGFLATASGKAKMIGRPPTRNPNLPGESNNTVKSFAKSAASGKIPDLSDHYNTILTPNEEQEFGQWKTHMEATTGAHLGAHDYDIRGAWKSGLEPDGNLHWDDRFKKPNHPTFSSGSIYAQQTQRGRRRAAFTGSEPMGRPPGGKWTDHNGDGTHWTFTPSDHVMGIRGPEQMLGYFNAHEPHNNVAIGKELHVGTQGIGKLDRPSLAVVQRTAAPAAPAEPAEPAVSKSYKTPAWQREAGQNPKGGLNAKGRASAKREGHNLKPPVKSGDNPRRASFLARMGGSPGPEHDEHGKATRLLLALQAWGASSKADAKRKAAAMSERLKKKKLAKGRGEDARNTFSDSSASGLSEDAFPTGKMMAVPHGDDGYMGVFGEKRHIRVEASKFPHPTHIEWIHVLPGTKVEPHHVTQIFEGLHNAGFEKPMTWDAIKDPDERFSGREFSRRDRLFRPLAAQWKKFVAAKQAKMSKALKRKKE